MFSSSVRGPAESVDVLLLLVCSCSACLILLALSLRPVSGNSALYVFLLWVLLLPIVPHASIVQYYCCRCAPFWMYSSSGRIYAHGVFHLLFSRSPVLGVVLIGEYENNEHLTENNLAHFSVLPNEESEKKLCNPSL